MPITPLNVVVFIPETIVKFLSFPETVLLNVISPLFVLTVESCARVTSFGNSIALLAFVVASVPASVTVGVVPVKLSEPKVVESPSWSPKLTVPEEFRVTAPVTFELWAIACEVLFFPALKEIFALVVVSFVGVFVLPIELLKIISAAPTFTISSCVPSTVLSNLISPFPVPVFIVAFSPSVTAPGNSIALLVVKLPASVILFGGPFGDVVPKLNEPKVVVSPT